jgi:acyl carrier protein
MTAAKGIGIIKEKLLAACLEQGLFEAADVPGIWNADLIDSGAINSMGLLALEGILEENFGVAIPHEMLVAELRTLNKLAEHVHAQGAGA